jgi:hypothetical protein
MAMSCKSESQLLSHEELQTVRATHHPAIYECDLKELRAVQARLRAEHAKLRTLINRSRRIHRGKPDPREHSSSPANAEHLQRRKQVFAKALKRVNNEVKRLRKYHANAMLAEAAHRALASRRANFVLAPSGGRTTSEGMHTNPSTRRRKTISRNRIGSVSQATKVAQAIRDARGSVPNAK